jgi:hypothetical protein
MISTGKLKIYTIDGLTYSAKTGCNTVRIVPRWHRHASSGAVRPSDIAVTANFNAESNLMAVNRIIECISRDFVTEYGQRLGSIAVYTAHPVFFKSLRSHSNRSLSHLLLQMHIGEIIPTFLTSNIYIRLWHPKPLTLI